MFKSFTCLKLTLKKFRSNYSPIRHLSTKFQYFSDVHVDSQPNNHLPKIKAIAPYLLLPGDIGIGQPNKQNGHLHPNFKSFMDSVSYSYDKVFFVPGNHDFDCGTLYEP